MYHTDFAVLLIPLTDLNVKLCFKIFIIDLIYLERDIQIYIYSTTIFINAYVHNKVFWYNNFLPKYKSNYMSSLFLRLVEMLKGCCSKCYNLISILSSVVSSTTASSQGPWILCLCLCCMTKIQGHMILTNNVTET